MSCTVAIGTIFKEDIVIETSRKQRIKRMQMKKPLPKKPRTKKPVQLVETPWHIHAQGLPLALFHTTVGPIIGHVEKVEDDAGPFNLRLWAPAAIRMGFQPGQPGALVAQYSVTFQPIALVETYLDLSAGTPFGRSPVPEALVSSYTDYFARVVAGEYAFTRVTARVQQATPHETTVESAPAKSNEEPSFPWNGVDHYDWLTRKIYGIPEDVTIDRDDARRHLVKRSLLGWAFGTKPEKVSTDFDLDVSDVEYAYSVFDEVLPEVEDKVRVQKIIPPPKEIRHPDDENTLS